ncbi:hypothetical protein DXG03_002582 [Asterophora parasitica]|uniref:Uncharacterized protein n=1 Tax=Asterophora parasitica TaxID=117018 RepID=A0A9P7G476_9AGAR|nr:hypothetical protein DXG03_002582 [Asterophora parasitica]
MTQGISDSISRWDNLLSLHVEGSITAEALHDVARIPSLQSLRLARYQSRSGSKLRPPVIGEANGTSMFSALRRLTLDGMELEWSSNLLSAVTDSRLETIDLTFPAQSDSTDDWHSFFNNLQPSTATLMTLKVKEYDLVKEDTAHIDAAIFQPLLSLQNLAHIEIHPARHTDIDDDLLKRHPKPGPTFGILTWYMKAFMTEHLTGPPFSACYCWLTAAPTCAT